MQNASQGLGQGRFEEGKIAGDLDRIRRGHCHKLCHRPLQPGDAVLAVVNELVRISSLAVLTQRGPPCAVTVVSLIHNDAVTRLESPCRTPHFCHLSAELVAQDLSLLLQWDPPARGVHVVVSFAAEDVDVRTTKSYSGDANQEFVRTQLGYWDVPNRYP